MYDDNDDSIVSSVINATGQGSLPVVIVAIFFVLRKIFLDIDL